MLPQMRVDPKQALETPIPLIELGFVPGSAEDQYARAIDRNSDGRISVVEMQMFDNDPSRIRNVRLSTILAVEQQMRVKSPSLETNQQALARSLVKVKGTATEADADVIVAHLVRLPVRVLEGMRRTGVSVVVCRGNVTDYATELRGVQPRGWEAGKTWELVPGMLQGKDIVVATVDAGTFDKARAGQRALPPTGMGHGSHNLLWHEFGHALNAYFFAGYHDRSDVADACAIPARETPKRPEPEPAPTEADFGGTGGAHATDFATEAISSRHRAFLAARAADWDKLTDYYRQGGKGPSAGADETLVESLARYFGRDPTLEKDWPALYAYWQSNPFADPALRALAARQHGCR